MKRRIHDKVQKQKNARLRFFQTILKSETEIINDLSIK